MRLAGRWRRLHSSDELVHVEVVLGLKVQPEPLRGPKVPGQPKRGVRRNCPRAVDDLVDPTRRNSDVLGQPVLTDPHGLEELLSQYLAWMDRWKSLGHHLLLVVVHDLDVERIRAPPPEADPPPVVDPDAVLARAITS